MKPPIPHRPWLTCLVLLLVLCALPRPCAALYEIMDLSRERAKELGITVRSQPSANHDTWVKVEFKTTGALKEFKWADLELTQNGKRLVTAALMPRKAAVDSPADSVLLEFYIDPASLPNATVTIVTYPVPRSGQGYRLKMKDFLPPAAPPQ